MRRVIKRVIKTEITEIWTISWVDEPRPTQTDTAASEAAQSSRKSQASSPCDLEPPHQSPESDAYD